MGGRGPYQWKVFPDMITKIHNATGKRQLCCLGWENMERKLWQILAFLSFIDLLKNLLATFHSPR